MKYIKKFFCFIGWHSPSNKWELVEVSKDPLHTGYCNMYRCPWCGYEGMIDSQGNLF